MITVSTVFPLNTPNKSYQQYHFGAQLFKQLQIPAFLCVSVLITVFLSFGLLIGAGPGGAFSYHGGGHGGRGGGFYQDRNTTRLYGWNYFDTIYLLGGSTGEIVNPGND